MSVASAPDAWKTLRGAVSALLQAPFVPAEGAFIRAAKRLKAAAIVLLFALARTFLDQTIPVRTIPKQFTRTSRGRSAPNPERWRNPPVTAYRIDLSTDRTAPLRTKTSPERAQAQGAKALATLQGVLALCAAPEIYARRLAHKIAASDAVLIAAEAKAFGETARHKAARDREAWRFLEQERRARRRRRDSG